MIIPVLGLQEAQQTISRLEVEIQVLTQDHSLAIVEAEVLRKEVGIITEQLAAAKTELSQARANAATQEELAAVRAVIEDLNQDLKPSTEESVKTSEQASAIAARDQLGHVKRELVGVQTAHAATQQELESTLEQLVDAQEDHGELLVIFKSMEANAASPSKEELEDLHDTAHEVAILRHELREKSKDLAAEKAAMAEAQDSIDRLVRRLAAVEEAKDAPATQPLTEEWEQMVAEVETLKIRLSKAESSASDNA